jgi:hypothetical protein
MPYFEELNAAKDFLEKTDFKVNAPVRDSRSNMISCRTVRGGIGFCISYTQNNGYKFSWQTRDRDDVTMAKFEKIEKDIHKLCPGAKLERRVKSRFFIPIDQDKPLESILKVINDTRFIIGYTG